MLNHAVFSLYCLICKDSEPVVDFAAESVEGIVEPLVEPLVVDVTCGLYLIG